MASITAPRVIIGPNYRNPVKAVNITKTVEHPSGNTEFRMVQFLGTHREDKLT